jgi:C-terminal peptidase prc
MAFFKKMNKTKGFLAGVALSGTAFFFIHAKSNDPYFEISKNLDIYSNLFRELNTYYVDPIQPGRLVKAGVDAMLEDLDPYTNYITESDIEEYEFMTTGKYGGIGASMRKKADDIYIGDVYENSPAHKAGLHPGDMLEAIDNQPVKGKSIEDLSLLLKGSPGTQISMKIKDAFTHLESVKMVTRGEIEISSVPYYSLIGEQNNIAYVRLTQFTQGCARQVKDAFDSLQRAQPALKGMVLDLRNNPGGLLDEAVAICNIFVDKNQLVVSTKGKVYSLQNRNGKKLAIELRMDEMLKDQEKFSGFSLESERNDNKQLAGCKVVSGSIRYKNGTTTPVTYTKEWKPSQPIVFERFPGAAFLPLDFFYKDESGLTMSFEAEKVAPGPVENAVFRLPADYKIISYNEYKELSK